MKVYTSCRNCGGPIRAHNKYGYCTKTRPCRANRWRAKYETRDRYRDTHPDSVKWESAKSRAAKKGIEFTITREDIREVWTDTCPVFGYKLRFNHAGTRAHLRESYSLDRIDNSKGYIPGNIQILSNRANAMKSDATPEELIRFADWIYETYGNH